MNFERICNRVGVLIGDILIGDGQMYLCVGKDQLHRFTAIHGRGLPEYSSLSIDELKPESIWRATLDAAQFSRSGSSDCFDQYGFQMATSTFQCVGYERMWHVSEDKD